MGDCLAVRSAGCASQEQPSYGKELWPASSAVCTPALGPLAGRSPVSWLAGFRMPRCWPRAPAACPANPFCLQHSSERKCGGERCRGGGCTPESSCSSGQYPSAPPSVPDRRCHCSTSRFACSSLLAPAAHAKRTPCARRSLCGHSGRPLDDRHRRFDTNKYTLRHNCADSLTSSLYSSCS